MVCISSQWIKSLFYVLSVRFMTIICNVQYVSLDSIALTDTDLCLQETHLFKLQEVTMTVQWWKYFLEIFLVTDKNRPKSHCLLTPPSTGAITDYSINISLKNNKEQQPFFLYTSFHDCWIISRQKVVKINDI